MEAIEQLKSAFHGDDAVVVRETLRRHPELKLLVNEPIGPFDSPAICGVRSRKMLDVLLEAGADINGKSRWWAGGFCLLDSASDQLSEYAIAKGAVVSAHAAARLGKMDRLRELIEMDPQLVHARGGDGKLPLHFARNVEVAEFLLEHGAEINARDIDHESTAAQHLIGERPEVVRFLVNRGCETDIFLAAALGDLSLAKRMIENDPGCLRLRIDNESFPMSNPRAGGTIYTWTLGSNVSPHQVARKFGHEELLNLLMEKSPVEVRLVNWCSLGEEKRAREVVEANPELVQRLSASDQRALAVAARENQTAVVVLMLEVEFPIEVRDQHGATPLHWAAWHGNPRTAEAVLKAGGKSLLKIRDRDHNATPLDWAKHGRENSWHRATGDYPAVLRLLESAAK